MNPLLTHSIALLLLTLLGFFYGLLYARKKGIPGAAPAEIWSIGIYRPEGPLLKFFPPKNIQNPVLTAKDVKDTKAYFVADPFLIKREDKLFLFFEILEARGRKGCVGLATSQGGLTWNYHKVVLREDFHISYPQVFEWKDNYYMVVESAACQSVRLYKSTSFPFEWKFEKSLIDGEDFLDPNLVRHEGLWWLFTNTINKNEFEIFYTEELMGEWLEHPANPINVEESFRRNAGRILLFNEKLYRPAQKKDRRYGQEVRLFQITRLDTTSYEETEVDSEAILQRGSCKWNADGMHHIDASLGGDLSIVAVDGYKRLNWCRRQMLWGQLLLKDLFRWVG